MVHPKDPKGSIVAHCSIVSGYVDMSLVTSIAKGAKNADIISMNVVSVLSVLIEYLQTELHQQTVQ